MRIIFLNCLFFGIVGATLSANEIKFDTYSYWIVFLCMFGVQINNGI